MEFKPETLAFVRSHVRTMWALEQLLLMHSATPRAFTVAELVGELRSTETLVERNLTAFERAGLVAPTPDGAFRFAPANEELREHCAAIAALNQERPLLLREAVTSADDRLRELANAFRLWGKPK